MQECFEELRAYAEGLTTRFGASTLLQSMLALSAVLAGQHKVKNALRTFKDYLHEVRGKK